MRFWEIFALRIPPLQKIVYQRGIIQNHPLPHWTQTGLRLEPALHDGEEQHTPVADQQVELSQPEGVQVVFRFIALHKNLQEFMQRRWVHQGAVYTSGYGKQQSLHGN